MLTKGNRAGCKLDIFELEADMERAATDSLDVFVKDDALEFCAPAERTLFDDFELIWKGDAREGGAILECLLSYIGNVAVFTEYHTHEMSKAHERTIRNALKIGTTGEVDSKEESHLLKGCWSSHPIVVLKGSSWPHPITVRLRHLKESSMEPWERLASSSLFFSAPERS